MNNRNKSLLDFNPSSIGIENGNLYGLPYFYENSGIIVFGIPWEVTVSYKTGTGLGPLRVLEASPQLDLYDLDNPHGWKQGIFMPSISQFLLTLNQKFRKKALKIIEATEKNIDIKSCEQLQQELISVNSACQKMVDWVDEQASAAIQVGKKVGIVGGDHSVPLGYIQALARHNNDFGILHIDAHADLRVDYQGFYYSHASIMNNVLKIPQVIKLVQVGIRDFCEEETVIIRSSNNRIITYYDSYLKKSRYEGVSWYEQCQKIISNLPEQVYISFDLDGLDPKLCPHTGTPVAGGLNLEAVFYLLKQVIDSNRKIIGFDVSEVGNGEWDGNVGARIIYKLCCLLGL
ncbi:agmatinase family protein [Candidatus Atelocyanobacterium thalassae]|uniref:Arginase family hydrolase, arginase/agmainase/formiminoglutamate hydrolase n=1 Tax=Atelocyanobacterium thalassa (isolate ALOHA) TaxID=1453429 RepID=D3EP94_ATETH|nr:agmatinase family protein [Candidatus Atelocyanobacterium thalassa]ADB95294.1 arginase family hydrolase, arginase/agmainase/formiminoglutamate hydrolase [Candidatus Atelocyanobacterium thalassa isolate ALOHA]MCH2544013.1 agmatinase family protein [Candidatus Atelocyanobacterium sp. ALOHA_A2.5_9]|tara:strand:+ start:77812 stop:78849 length:1038 start_codon:yes stop_codon:yes gene_type:complete